MKLKVYDIIGIGIGPFNLGLAALADSIPNLSCAFFDQNPSFNWHPGLLLENARLQVPFLADLVTLADTSSKFSYLKYLQTQQRIIPFGIHEQNYILRKEYNVYCQWAISQLKNLHFGCRCESIEFITSRKAYKVLLKQVSSGSSLNFYATHIVLGVGTVPSIPDFASEISSDDIIHSSEYLFAKERIVKNKSISIIGSGQSAAEIFSDLIHNPEMIASIESLDWFSRADRFYPMDLSKLTLEMTSPDYIDYFFDLPRHKKKEVLAKQDMLYKGISISLIAEIYDLLYCLKIENPEKKIHIWPNRALQNISLDASGKIQLDLYHTEMETAYRHETESVVLATGYKYLVPDFLQSVKERIRFDEDGLNAVNKNYSIDSQNSIFVQNAELHSHGFNAADLGMGAHRNSVILNTIICHEHFKPEKNITFQIFGLPHEKWS
jgi:lysine N6-hydroxylase